jgi:hypothetical protein
MKKVFLTLGIFAFLLGGVVAIETVSVNQVDKVVYDDPPKAEKKSDKGCADLGMKSSGCCASKSASAAVGKSDCGDKKETKTASVTTDTKKDSPDKK